MRNFGKKSLDEMKERLVMRGFLPPESDSPDLDELDEDVDEADDELDDEAQGGDEPFEEG
jgi:hypothetical protein